MSLPRAREVQQVSAGGADPPNSFRGPASNGTALKDDEDTRAENTKNSANLPSISGEQPLNNGANAPHSPPTDAIAAQPQSIWHKYVTIAEKWDRRMMEKWKTNMNNLLIFSALFTAIVTAFVLDAMSDLDEDTATKLLRILVEQSVNGTNSAIEIPPSEPPSSVLTVSSLWFLSIMSSLAATTWAILCLESCAFLSDGVQAEDYEEMAEKRQRRFEAMKFWRMHFVVAGIPFFLHVSLFLFLAGLWLRLRDVNKQLEFIVRIPSLLIALTYVTVTLLPIFTHAPFSTSVSELAQPVVDEIRRIHHFIRPPRAFVLLARVAPWIASLPLVKGLRDILPSFKLSPDPGLIGGWFISPLKPIYEIAGPFIHMFLESVLLIIPTFGPDQNPFNELTKLKVGTEDKGIHIRALFWLMNTPLSREEVKEILKEFTKYPGKNGEPLDRTIIRLLVLSLSSILENGKVSDDEQPIFDHCTKVLAEGMDRVFGDKGHSQRITFWGTTVSQNLLHHFHLDTPGEDTVRDYWERRAIPALWLCPEAKTITSVIDQLNRQGVRLVEKSHLQRIVRGFHAAILARFGSDPSQSTLELIPDFSLWDWDSGSSDPGLDNALLGFLRGLFAAFYTTLQESDHPNTTPSLIVDCLERFDEQPYRCTSKLHNALCFFVAVIQRSHPEIFKVGPSVADALFASIESYQMCNGGDDSCCAKTIAARLRAFVYGPKPSISRGSRSLTNLYARLPDSIRADDFFIEGFIDANAAILQAILAAGNNFATLLWQRVSHHEAVREASTSQFFIHNAPLDFVRHHPNYRLPYLYSLAITLSYVAEERDWKHWKVADLLVTRGKQEEITVDRTLDTNILVVSILTFITHGKFKTGEREREPGTTERDLKTKFLESLQNIVFDFTDWRTRWKSIYLITDIVSLLSQMNQDEKDGQTGFLIGKANRLLEGVGRVPSDWVKKREGLECCGLETRVKELSEQDGTGGVVYEWSGRENIPYLSLYNSRWTSTIPVSHWVMNLQRGSGDPMGPEVEPGQNGSQGNFTALASIVEHTARVGREAVGVPRVGEPDSSNDGKRKEDAEEDL